MLKALWSPAVGDGEGNAGLILKRPIAREGFARRDRGRGYGVRENLEFAGIGVAEEQCIVGTGDSCRGGNRGGAGILDGLSGRDFAEAAAHFQGRITGDVIEGSNDDFRVEAADRGTDIFRGRGPQDEVIDDRVGIVRDDIEVDDVHLMRSEGGANCREGTGAIRHLDANGAEGWHGFHLLAAMLAAGRFARVSGLFRLCHVECR